MSRRAMECGGKIRTRFGKQMRNKVMNLYKIMNLYKLCAI